MQRPRRPAAPRRSRNRRRTPTAARRGVAPRASGAGSSSRSSLPSFAGAADGCGHRCRATASASGQPSLRASMPRESSRTAANSRASGKPSSWRHNASTAGALFGSSVKPRPRAAARSTNSETASDRHASPLDRSPDRASTSAATVRRLPLPRPAPADSWQGSADPGIGAAGSRPGRRPHQERARSCRGSGAGAGRPRWSPSIAVVHGADRSWSPSVAATGGRDVRRVGDLREWDEAHAIG